MRFQVIIVMIIIICAMHTEMYFVVLLQLHIELVAVAAVVAWDEKCSAQAKMTTEKESKCLYHKLHEYINIDSC